MNIIFAFLCIKLRYGYGLPKGILFFSINILLMVKNLINLFFTLTNERKIK